MKGTGIVAAALLGASALVSGCAGYTERTVVVRPVAVVPTGEQAEFAARLRERMDRINEHVLEEVREGDMPQVALEDVRNRRGYIEQLLSQYGADGRFQDDERNHLEQLVDAMERAEEHYERRGGGPVYVAP